MSRQKPGIKQQNHPEIPPPQEIPTTDPCFLAIATLSLQGICISDTNKIIFANKAMATILGYDDAASLLGLDKDILMHPHEQDHQNNSREGEIPSQTSNSGDEIFYKRINGTIIRVLQQETTIHYRKKSALLTIVTDISRSYQQQQELIKTKVEYESVNKSKTQFLAHMSHELRTPLNAIIGFSDVMRKQMFGSLGNAKYLEYTNDINQSAMHLLDLISDILDLSRVESGRVTLEEKWYSVQSLFEPVLKRAAANGDHRKITFKSLPSLQNTKLYVDRKSLYQILDNLLFNAIKFTDPQTGIIEVNAALQERDFYFTIQDNGVGVHQQDLQIISMPFEQVFEGHDENKEKQSRNSTDYKHKGVGLGLAIVKALLDAHGGTLHLDSTIGNGFIATVTLPAHRVKAQKPKKDHDQNKTRKKV